MRAAICLALMLVTGVAHAQAAPEGAPCTRSDSRAAGGDTDETRCTVVTMEFALGQATVAMVRLQARLQLLGNDLTAMRAAVARSTEAEAWWAACARNPSCSAWVK